MENNILFVIFAMKTVILVLAQSQDNVQNVKKDFSITRDLALIPALSGLQQMRILVNVRLVLKVVTFALHLDIIQTLEHSFKYVPSVNQIGSLLVILLQLWYLIISTESVFQSRVKNNATKHVHLVLKAEAQVVLPVIQDTYYILIRLSLIHI